MKSISNKEVIDRLIEYLLTQDPKIVARSLANAMIDFNRMYHLLDLPLNERNNLLNRIEKNSKEVRRFAEHGPDGDLKLHNIPSD